MFERIRSILRTPGAGAKPPHAPNSRDRSMELQAQGEVFLSAGNLLEATRCFRSAIEAEPGNPSAYPSLGHVLRQQGQVDEAIRVLQRALPLDDRAIDVHYLLALSFQERGRPADSIRHFESLLDLDPDVVDAYVRLCQTFVQSGNMPAAAAIVEKGLARRPEDPDLHYLSANLKLHHGQPEDAVASHSSTGKKVASF